MPVRPLASVGPRASRLIWIAIMGLLGVALEATAQTPRAPEWPDLETFLQATAGDDELAEAALERIGEAWSVGSAAILWDLVRFTQPPRRTVQRNPAGDPGGFPRSGFGASVAPEHPTTRVWRRLMDFLEDHTDLRLGRGAADLATVQHWIWEQPYTPHPDYAEFKGLWYGEIDPAFRDFFPPGTPSTIRLDEVDWGGVPVNGIPPLDYPAHTEAGTSAAEYLDDDDIVFGIAVGGRARAYPKRILAWHEMALDRLGEHELTIVYCTLCGTVIPYDSVVDGRHVRFGTSGLLYRSNKLMFDHETKSLWNTFQGVPVIGPLVDGESGSVPMLRHRSVVTTTWEEWQRAHPDTTVLTLDTGHDRDYREGVAYRDYFATDRLMFEVPELDDRLDPKDEVLVMVARDESGSVHPVAIDVEYLEDHRVFQFEHASRNLVVVTSREGASRTYEASEQRFDALVSDSDDEDGLRVRAADGAVWRVEEDALVRDGVPGARLARYPAHRAFWFGWYAQFPQTQLIK